MKEVVNKRVYQCEYCSKVSLRKSAIKSHEKWCKKNPNAFTLCRSCQHCKRQHERINLLDMECFESTNYEEIVNITDFICEIDNAKMYAPKVVNGSRKFRHEIIARCDRIMCTLASGCPNYTKIENNSVESDIREDLETIFGEL